MAVLLTLYLQFFPNIYTKEDAYKKHPLSVSINLSARLQSAKKEVIFFKTQLVGVRWYGRDVFWKKQAAERIFR